MKKCSQAGYVTNFQLLGGRSSLVPKRCAHCSIPSDMQSRVSLACYQMEAFPTGILFQRLELNTASGVIAGAQFNLSQSQARFQGNRLERTCLCFGKDSVEASDGFIHIRGIF